MKRFLKYGRGKREALYGINYFVLINGNITFQEAAQFNYRIYNKKATGSFKLEDIHFMILEMRRAELVHWLSMIPIVIFIKAPKYILFINVCYVISANLPIILTQRYNRPRLEHYYQLRMKRDERTCRKRKSSL